MEPTLAAEPNAPPRPVERQESIYPPGPSSHPAVQTLRWFYRPIAFMEGCRREFGETFSVVFVGFETPMVLFSDPVAVKALYSNREHGLPPGRTLTLEPLLGSRSVLLLTGDEHLSRRKLMLPPFHGERMRAYEDVVSEVVDREISSWPVGEEFALHPRMQAVTLEVILRAVFGVDDDGRLERLRELLRRVLGQTASPGVQLAALALRRFGDRGPWAKFEQLLRRSDEELFALIRERREDPGLAERDDILSALLVARFEDGEPISDQEVRDQLMTLLMAGHETTATALAWSFDMLLRNPGPLGALRDDVRGGDGEYLKATISEALRLRPVVPIAGRRLASELEIDGHLLPAGTDVTPSIWLTHTRPDVYPDPYAFKPERFLDGGPDTYAWIPFGGGVRRCLGAAFAEFEMGIVLREVVRRCELRVTRAEPERIGRRNITLSPRNGTPVVMAGRPRD